MFEFDHITEQRPIGQCVGYLYGPRDDLDLDDGIAELEAKGIPHEVETDQDAGETTVFVLASRITPEGDWQ